MKIEIPLLKDKKGKYLKEGDIVEHKGNLYFVKWSESLNYWILRANNDMGMNWRDMQWFERCSKYCEIIGTINPF